MKDNPDYTTVNAIIIMTVIIKLLQYDANSDQYKQLIHESANKDHKLTDYSQMPLFDTDANASNNCAYCFLNVKMGPILEGFKGNSVFQEELANYLCACSDRLDYLVSDHARYAVTIGEGYRANEDIEFPHHHNNIKKEEFRDISANDFPYYPA